MLLFYRYYKTSSQTVLGNLMTDCTERILSWQADSYSVNKEIARRLLTPKLIT
jgi:hypothetical protein